MRFAKHMLEVTVQSKTEAILERRSHNTTTPASWEVLYKAQRYGNPLKVMRVEVTFPDGKKRFLRPSFKTRTDLDRYIARFHPQYQGKEVKRPACPANWLSSALRNVNKLIRTREDEERRLMEWTAWISLSLQEQSQRLDEYLGGLTEPEQRAILHEWRSAQSYRSLIPVGAQEHDKGIFTSNLRILIELSSVRLGMNPHIQR